MEEQGKDGAHNSHRKRQHFPGGERNNACGSLRKAPVIYSGRDGAFVTGEIESISYFCAGDSLSLARSFLSCLSSFYFFYSTLSLSIFPSPALGPCTSQFPPCRIFARKLDKHLRLSPLRSRTAVFRSEKSKQSRLIDFLSLLPFPFPTLT